MDSKEILETFGISKNFGIILFIQSIIVILGCFLAFQDMYVNLSFNRNLLLLSDAMNLLFFIFLVYYSFVGFRKSEKYFKIAVYFFILYSIILLLTNIGTSIALNSNVYIFIIGSVIRLILVCYFAYNLNNYNKAKIAILLLVLSMILVQVIYYFSGKWYFTQLIYLIPSVSLALTYFARYNKKGFKKLSK